MKLKARCPNCEIAQMFFYKPGEAPAQVQCHMEWCKQTFVPTKSNERNMYGPKEDNVEDLRNAKASAPVDVSLDKEI